MHTIGIFQQTWDDACYNQFVDVSEPTKDSLRWTEIAILVSSTGDVTSCLISRLTGQRDNSCRDTAYRRLRVLNCQLDGSKAGLRLFDFAPQDAAEPRRIHGQERAAVFLLDRAGERVGHLCGYTCALDILRTEAYSPHQLALVRAQIGFNVYCGKDWAEIHIRDFSLQLLLHA